MLRSMTLFPAPSFSTQLVYIKGAKLIPSLAAISFMGGLRIFDIFEITLTSLSPAQV
ncbi:hypothetical protein RchiOBHm_Chr4g0398921 [Rosa chinensis]|uniref:Uncharacterized protein n=1 Tax=Rosa chinensis TaxID=74649 RepID=A0A2P6QSF3_ROSCH|nr:hypothetical protein RchiOBHm_Chr4g0398921 [Rosa chinensis]